MSVESADDRLAMLDADEFGVSATWTPDGGSASTVVGIFDNEFRSTDVGAGAEIATDDPHFLCRSADVSGIAEGDALSVSGTDYTIRVVMADGTGMTELVLEEDYWRTSASLSETTSLPR
jgi:hypothetical protein